jgi:hypothetical protein
MPFPSISVQVLNDIKQGRENATPYQAELKKRRGDKHTDTDYKLNCRQYFCKKFTKKHKENKTRESLSQAYVGIPRPWFRQEKWYWEPTHCFPLPKEHCQSEISQASTDHKYKVLPVCPSGNKRKMNKKQGWDGSNRETPKGLAIDLSIVNLSPRNPT